MNLRTLLTLEAARDGRLIEVEMEFTRLTEDQVARGWLPCDSRSKHTQPARTAIKKRLIYMRERHAECPDYRYWGLTKHGVAALAEDERAR